MVYSIHSDDVVSSVQSELLFEVSVEVSLKREDHEESSSLRSALDTMVRLNITIPFIDIQNIAVEQLTSSKLVYRYEKSLDVSLQIAWTSKD